MKSIRQLRMRRHGLAIGLLVGALSLVAVPVQASDSGSGSGSGSTPSVSQAQQSVSAAQASAAQASTQLGMLEQNLAIAQSRLAGIQAQEVQLTDSITSDQARVGQLDAEITQDRLQLADYLRSRFEGGDEQSFVYVMASGSFSTAVQRAMDVSHVGEASDLLVAKMQQQEAEAQQTLADARAAKQQLDVADEQATTAMAVVQVDEEDAAQTASQDNLTLNLDKTQLNQALKLQAQQEVAAQAAKAAAAARAAAASKSQQQNVTYTPVTSATFSVNTNLTAASGLTAADINQYLAGTGLAGLGSAYIQAEQTYHVNAQYLVAHSILESGWGTSALALNKDNLFGFGANDSNPYGDAMSFASDQDCILYVAQFVATHYLDPAGPYYHGPTLLGMNVDYASDPLWAFKIASIADTIPMPS